MTIPGGVELIFLFLLASMLNSDDQINQKCYPAREILQRFAGSSINSFDRLCEWILRYGERAMKQ